MRILLINVILALSILMMTACFKEDEMIIPHPRGDVKTDTIKLTDNYQFQVFYSLDSGRAIRTLDKTSYDLGFESSINGFRIILNTSNFMTISNLGDVPFGSAYDTAGTNMAFDPSSGNLDSTAIGNWFEVNGSDTLYNRQVYALNMGIDVLGNPRGLYQVTFDSLKGDTYYFRYAKLSGGTISNGQVKKEDQTNFSWFSIGQSRQIPVEPPHTSYDIVFTQYTTLLFTDEGDPYPYLVTGVLSNRKDITVAKDTLDAFTSMTRESASNLTYSKLLDAVGYDWKYYDFNSGTYTIVPRFSYVIRTSSGFLHKLRFIGFYDKNGSKGYPVIEFQKL